MESLNSICAALQGKGVCVRIRSYRKGDSESMRRIAPRAFMGLGLARYAIDRELDRKRVADYYAREASGYAERAERRERTMEVIVAEDSGNVVAYIVVALDDGNSEQFGLRWGRIVSLAVEPDHQAKGIGKMLVARALDWLASVGAAYVEVLTDQNNVAAQRAYEANGFRAIYASITFSRRLEPTSSPRRS